MSIFTRRTTEPETDSGGPIWDLAETIRDHAEDVGDGIDWIGRRVHPQIPMADEPAEVRGADHKWHCGSCPVVMPFAEWQAKGHRCVLTPREEARRKRAAEQLAIMARIPGSNTVHICEWCRESWTDRHTCSGPKLSEADKIALDWQQAGARKALRDMLGRNGEDHGASPA